MNVEMLAKLLMLATSDNPHESSLAFKKATEILKKANLDWAKFVHSKIIQADFGASSGIRAEAYREGYNEGYEKGSQKTQRSSHQGQTYTPDDEKIRRMLEFCIVNCGEGILGFVESLREQYLVRGWLTPKQITALENIYRRASRTG